MDYSRKLVLSMAISTAMVATAGLAVMLGAWWLAGQAPHIDAAKIAHAAGAQSQGLDRVNHAVAELDRMTRQNAALVEQGAAAAAALHEQPGRLTQAVSRFEVSRAAGWVSGALHARRPATRVHSPGSDTGPPAGPQPRCSVARSASVTSASASSRWARFSTAMPAFFVSAARS